MFRIIDDSSIKFRYDLYNYIQLNHANENKTYQYFLFIHPKKEIIKYNTQY